MSCAVLIATHSDLPLPPSPGSTEQGQASLKAVVHGIADLVPCGFVDIKPSVSKGNPFQDANFKVPMPSGSGYSVRNVMAFHVLHSSFLKVGHAEGRERERGGGGGRRKCVRVCSFCGIQFAHPTFGWCRRKPRPCAQLCSTRSLRSSPVTQVCLQWMLVFPVSANRFIDPIYIFLSPPPPANYFILEPQHTLALFIERVDDLSKNLRVCRLL